MTPERHIDDHLDWTLDRLAGTGGVLPAEAGASAWTSPALPTIVVSDADAARIVATRIDEDGQHSARNCREQLAVRGGRGEQVRAQVEARNAYPDAGRLDG